MFEYFLLPLTRFILESSFKVSMREHGYTSSRKVFLHLHPTKICPPRLQTIQQTLHVCINWLLVEARIEPDTSRLTIRSF